MREGRLPMCPLLCCGRRGGLLVLSYYVSANVGRGILIAHYSYSPGRSEGPFLDSITFPCFRRLPVRQVIFIHHQFIHWSLEIFLASLLTTFTSEFIYEEVLVHS